MTKNEASVHVYSMYDLITQKCIQKGIDTVNAELIFNYCVDEVIKNNKAKFKSQNQLEYYILKIVKHKIAFLYLSIKYPELNDSEMKSQYNLAYKIISDLRRVESDKILNPLSVDKEWSSKRKVVSDTMTHHLYD